MRITTLIAATLVLAACAEEVEDERLDDAALDAPPVTEVTPGGPEPVGAAAEMDADENVPSLAEVQNALRQCAYESDVLEVECSATGEGTEFTCRYTLDGDTTEREAFIAADGDTYTLIDIPEDCPVQ